MASAKRHRSGRSPAAATVERKHVCFHLEDKGVQVLIQRNWQNVNQEQSTMDSHETRTLHPREVLRQVADSMNWQRNELSVTLPAHTTWRAAIQAAVAVLGDIDESMLLMPRGTGKPSSSSGDGTPVNFGIALGKQFRSPNSSNYRSRNG
ncbi:hypothetical protein BBP40_005754 [Aspergillus hancockii]|nr:hypothetical protein BBP40_005754 [Aspergillus hancockii]